MGSVRAIMKEVIVFIYGPRFRTSHRWQITTLAQQLSVPPTDRFIGLGNRARLAAGEVTGDEGILYMTYQVARGLLIFEATTVIKECPYE